MTKICIIAGNRREAEKYASTQYLERDQWFYPESINELLFKSNFHVIVTGSAGENIPASLFEKLYLTARERGKVNRI